MNTEELYVLQRCVRKFKDGRMNWETICRPVTLREGLAQLDAVHDHNQEYRLLTDCTEAMHIGSITREIRSYSHEHH